MWDLLQRTAAVDVLALFIIQSRDYMEIMFSLLLRERHYVEQKKEKEQMDYDSGNDGLCGYLRTRANI